MDFLTIGVYNTSEDDFFSKLTEHNIDTFCDVRQRRGVRGSKYAFVNSSRLQNKLSTLGIDYIYLKDLAPTVGIRVLQKQEDTLKGENKQERSRLSNKFIEEYRSQIIDDFDFDSFTALLEKKNSKRIVFFCVEEHAGACHRSIITQHLSNQFKITHL